MGFRTTLVLLVLALAVGGYLYFAKEPEPVDLNPQDQVIEDYATAQAEWIRLTKGDGTPAMEFKQRAGGWWLLEPVEDYASVARLQGLANTIDGTTLTLKYDIAEFRAEQGDEVVDRFLREAGLSPVPRGRIELRFPGTAPVAERTRELLIGQQGANSSEVYVLRDGKIYGGGIALWTAMNMSVEDARERLLFFHDENSAREVRAHHVTPTGEEADLILKKERGRGWQMVEPMTSRVEQGNARAFLDLLLSLKVRDFIEGQLQPEAIRPDRPAPDWVIDVEGVLAQKDRVELWEVQGQMVGRAASRPSGFRVEPHDVQRVFNGAVPRLRARWIQPYPINELRAIQVDPPGGQGTGFRLESSSGEDFKLVSPVTMATRNAKLGEFRHALVNFTVAEFVEGAPDTERFGLEQGFWNLTLEPRRGEPVRIRIGAMDGDFRTGDFVFVRRADEEQVFLVDASVVQELTLDWRELASRSVQRIAPAVTNLEIRAAQEGGAVAFWSLGDSGWERGGAGGIEPIAGEVVDELRELTAQDVLSKADWEALDGVLYEVRLGRNRPDGGAGDVLQTLEIKVPPEDSAAPGIALRIQGIDTVAYRVSRIVSGPIRQLLP